MFNYLRRKNNSDFFDLFIYPRVKEFGMALLEIGLVVLGVALGAAIGWLLASNRFSSEIIDLKARSETEESMDARIEREEAMTLRWKS